MKLLLQRLLGVLLFCALLQTSFSQVMNPADPVVEYEGGNVQQPNFGQIGDWVKTTSLNWNTEDYKCYIYKGHMFRVKFPTSYQHNVNDGKKYPIYIFWHGLGEAASDDGETFNLYDNEYHLLHGGERHKNFVNNGEFDGFLIYMQNQFGFYGTVHYDYMAEIIQNFLVPQNKGDIDRIIVNGLSAGGGAVWDFTLRHPRLVAACMPISNSANAIGNTTNRNILRFIPIWQFQGGRDNNPKQALTESVGANLMSAGANWKYTLYPTLGHGVWNNSWADTGYIPYLNAAHKANPVPLFFKYEFCVGETPNVTLGLTAGFAQYEWRKNGVVIGGATSNTYTVNSYGTYDCRFRRTAGGEWSEWSPKPIVVKLKDPTVPPDITTKGIMSRHIPAPDGNTGTTLQQPAGYLTYVWTRVGNAQVLSNADTMRVTTPGDYVVKVTEQFGCLSEFSAPFTVVNANGPNKPSPAANLIANPVSRTEMKLDWTDNPAPSFNETNFEVYMSQISSGPYTMVGLTGPDVTTFNVGGLTEGTRYYFIVRAVNNTGASAVSPEAMGTTIPDDQPPTAPGNLRITTLSTFSVGLAWDDSEDNVGVARYDIYIDGVKSYVSSNNGFTCFNLINGPGYKFIVRAVDDAGNESLPSNFVYALDTTNDLTPPNEPSNVSASAVSYKRINVSWADNSTNETGFEILRSTSPDMGFGYVGTVPANTTTYADSVGLDPLTTYFYQVRAIFSYGGSLLKAPPQARFKFNNNYDDASGNDEEFDIDDPEPVFDDVNKMEGSHSISVNGIDQVLELETSSNDFIEGSYTAKTIAFWMRSLSNTGNRMVFDLGGSDDGLAMRLDGDVLYAGIASNNSRHTISTPYNSSGWNHIALVYDTNTLKLYINGALAASNLALPFLVKGPSSNNSHIGSNNSSNSFNIAGGSVTRFVGNFDDFNIIGKALSQQELSDLINNVLPPNATTLAPPLAPPVPGGLTATGVSPSEVDLSWSEVTNETNYEVYRSYGDNLNFVLIKSLPANTTSYTDQNLYATTVAYYKVQAVNANGSQGFSNEDSARTHSHVPVLVPITNKFMRHSSELEVNIQATSVVSGDIDIDIDNLPPFGSFTPNGNGLGVITFNPSSAQQGTYPNITITASDEYGGESSVSFQLVVNDNYTPVFPAVSNANVNEGQSTLLNLSATDQNPGDVITFSFNGLPSFVTVTPGSGTAQLDIAPGYADHGVYNVTATANDGNNGSASRSFVITVNDRNPTKRIFIDFGDASLPPGNPWNVTGKAPQLNDNFPAFEDEDGITTAIGFRIVSAWGAVGNGSNVLGVNTGNNSGVYSDNVIRSAWWTTSLDQTMSFYGLDPSKEYTFTFFGSRGNVVDNRTSLYTIGGTTVSLNAAGNSQNTVSIPNVQPNPDGTLSLILGNAAGSNFGYLNAMVIETVYDDGSAPAKPKAIAAQLNGSNANVTWTDVAYNEETYEVWRAENDINGTYVQRTINGSTLNLQSYNDQNLAGNKTFFYKVRAINGYGSSPYSDIVQVTTGNGAPTMPAIANVTMRIQEEVTINLTVTDSPDDLLTITATNLPPWATLTDNGDGTGEININPGSSLGIFNNITVTARDDKGASVSRTFRIIVRDVFNSVYVNFSHNNLYPAPSPWNSFNTVPFTNKSLTNMIDDSESPSGISITQLTNWSGGNDQGASTGTNTGVFPDNVMKTVYYTSSSAPMRLRIAGLNTNNTRYNLVFFASRLAGDLRTTRYEANGVSVVLNAANNTLNTVQINGLVPDASGIIEFTCTKEGSSPFAYLGAMVIQSYVDDGLPFAPSNLVALPKSKKAIELTWTDKASNEENYEVQRATTYGGPYTVIATIAANSTSFMDSVGLIGGQPYYYRVRAKQSAIFSQFSNIASTSTYVFSTYINYNRQNSAPAPWNNTSRAPELGRSFSNLRNDLNNNTGLRFEIIENFSGDNPAGMITGNNSGVWPDNVLRSTWWVDAGTQAQLKFSNFNKNWQYIFVLGASRNGGGDRTSVYTINNKSVSLNASFNTMQTVQLNNVVPDENGEVILTVSLSQYAMFAYLGGMEIHGYVVGTASESNPGGRVNNTNDVVVVDGHGTNHVDLSDVDVLNRPRPETGETLITNAGTFPNPFVDQVTISAEFKTAQEKIAVRLIDMGGKVVANEQVGAVPAGIWNYRLDLSGKKLQNGNYILEIISSDPKIPPATFKLVKTE